MKKILFGFLICIGMLTALPCSAQTTETDIFKARVLEILETKEVKREDGGISIQQHLKLKGLEDPWKNKEFEFNGIGEIQLIKTAVYKKGDSVLVQHAPDPDGKDSFFVIEYDRTGTLYLLIALFALVSIIIGKVRGVRAFVGLGFSAAVIMYGILPLILRGWSPLGVTIAGCMLIFTFMIYFTEGWNTKSHLAILCMAASLVFVTLLSVLFSWMTRLTGTAQDDIISLIGIGKYAIDLKGLLLAGFLIGSLGAMDDVIIAQIEGIAQIKEANPSLPLKKIVQMGTEIGTAHMGAMINTLFLAYAGAALPILILFCIKEPPFLSFGHILSNEMIAAEIVRTLVGSIGLAAIMPLATWLAAAFYNPKEKKIA